MVAVSFGPMPAIPGIFLGGAGGFSFIPGIARIDAVSLAAGICCMGCLSGITPFDIESFADGIGFAFVPASGFFFGLDEAAVFFFVAGTFMPGMLCMARRIESARDAESRFVGVGCCAFTGATRIAADRNVTTAAHVARADWETIECI